MALSKVDLTPQPLFTIKLFPQHHHHPLHVVMQIGLVIARGGCRPREPLVLHKKNVTLWSIECVEHVYIPFAPTALEDVTEKWMLCFSTIGGGRLLVNITIIMSW